jgi:hypothetical protein
MKTREKNMLWNASFVEWYIRDKERTLLAAASRYPHAEAAQTARRRKARLQEQGRDQERDTRDEGCCAA